MHVSPAVKNLATYFNASARFYYVVCNEVGDCLYANPLFKNACTRASQEIFGKPLIAYMHDDDINKFRMQFELCKFGDQVLAISFSILTATGSQLNINWELSRYADDGDNPPMFQLIGYAASLNAENPDPANTKNIQERYKAFEQSAEGLWMVNLCTPVSMTQSPGDIIRHCRNEAVLSECNDNMARMYGYEFGTEMIGLRLEQMMDFDDPSWVNLLERFIKNNFSLNRVETKEFDKKGNQLYFLNNITGIVEDGSLVRIWGTQQDITSQREAEKQLKESELFYRNLIAESIDGVLLTDEKGLISFASPSLTGILGYLPEDITGRTLFEFCHPEDVELGSSTFQDEVQMDPHVKFINIRLLKNTGEWLWCIVRGHNLLHNPFVKKMVIYFADDTLRKQAQEKLIESERRFHNQAIILNSVTDIIVTMDLDRVVTSWNSVTEKLTGIMADEAIGSPFRDLLETDYSPYTREQVTDIVFNEGIWRGEVSFDGSGGEKKYLLHTISLFNDEEGKTIGVLGVGKDITERKKVEAKLQESELFYRNLIAHSLDGIVIADKNGLITYCAPSVFELSGYQPENLLGKTIYDFVHPEDVQSAITAYPHDAARKFSLNFLQLRLRHASGNWIWCSVRGHSLPIRPNEMSVVIYFTDDSKRKEMEDRVRESETHFRNLIHNLKQGVILQDGTGKLIVCNMSALDMLGLTEEQLGGSMPFDPRWNAIHEDWQDYQWDTHPVARVLATKKPVRDAVLGVFRPNKNDRVWLLVNAEPVLDDDGKMINVISSYTDITEQKRLSQELVEQEVQKQKHVTQATIDGQEKERQQIGKELHDNINQHLTTTRLYLEVAREKANGEVLEMINHSHKTLAAIINEIRQLSQSLVPPTLGDLGLIESIQELCDSIKRTHTFNIEFLCRYFNEENLPDNMKLMLFRISQEQVNNIVKHSGATTIRIRLQSDAETINLTISDDGKGFDPAVSKRGMGFSNITNRAGLFNGKVEIEAAPGKGCTLHVVIPLL